MNCDEVADLEEDYLLGNLKGEEMKDFERHLKACINCAKRLSGYEEVLGMMFGSLKPVAPSPHVRKAVLDQVDGMPQGPVVTLERPVRKPIWGRFGQNFGRILSPVAAVLVIGLTVATVFLSFQIQQVKTQQADMQQVLDLTSSPGSWIWPLTQPDVPFDSTAPRARMYARPDSDIYLLTATQLQPPPDGQVYRAWYTMNSTTVDYLGDVKPDPNGNAVLQVANPDHRAADITGCFITREKAGSPPDQPTGPEFLAWKKN
jgi:anti-sigma-K factor RskA